MSIWLLVSGHGGCSLRYITCLVNVQGGTIALGKRDQSVYAYSSKAGPVLIYSWGTSSAWLEKAAKLKTWHLVVFGVSRAWVEGKGLLRPPGFSGIMVENMLFLIRKNIDSWSGGLWCAGLGLCVCCPCLGHSAC